MYAVFAIPGRQVTASPGDTLRVDYLESQKEGDKVTFDKVLLFSNDGTVQIGTPYLDARVTATVIAHGRGNKVVVFKKKRRVDYHKKQGHRQWYTTLRVDSIEA